MKDDEHGMKQCTLYGNPKTISPPYAIETQGSVTVQNKPKKALCIRINADLYEQVQVYKKWLHDQGLKLDLNRIMEMAIKDLLKKE